MVALHMLCCAVDREVGVPRPRRAARGARHERGAASSSSATRCSTATSTAASAASRPTRRSRSSIRRPCVCAPGGAGLAAALAVADGRPVTLVDGTGERSCGRGAAWGAGCRGRRHRRPRSRRHDAGEIRITTAGGPCCGSTAAVGRRRRPDERVGARGDRLGRGRARRRLRRGVAARAVVREALALAAPVVPIVWDPHPTARPPVSGVRVVTPNLAEAVALEPAPGGRRRRSRRGARASALARRWEAEPSASRAARAAPCSRAARRRTRRRGRDGHRRRPVRRRGPLRQPPRRRPRGRARSPRRRDARGRGCDPVRRGGRRDGAAGCAAAAGRSSPPAAASTCCTQDTCARSRRPARSATASSCA